MNEEIETLKHTIYFYEKFCDKEVDLNPIITGNEIKALKKVLNQFEAYENMRKDLLELILFCFPALDQRESNFKDELLNILNKVGSDK